MGGGGVGGGRGNEVSCMGQVRPRRGSNAHHVMGSAILHIPPFIRYHAETMRQHSSGEALEVCVL